MMISEFIERTGFEPTASEYAKIEKAYYDFNGNKDEFCKAFVKNGGEKKIYKARAEEIAQLKSQLVEMEKQHKTEMEAREKQINDLTAAHGSGIDGVALGQPLGYDLGKSAIDVSVFHFVFLLDIFALLGYNQGGRGKAPGSPFGVFE